MGSKEVGQLKATVSLTTVEFNKGIETLSKQMSIVRQEFKNASANLDKVKDSMQIAGLRAESLTKQIDVQRKIVAQMSEAHRYAAERFGEESKQAVNYELKLKKAEGTLQTLEKALKSTNAEMKNQSHISADTQKKIEQVGKSFEDVGKKMTSIGKNMSMTVTAPLALIGKASLDLAMNAVESENLFEVSMGSMAGSAREFSEQLREDLGLNAYEVRKNTATLNDMTHSMGLSATESYKISTGLTKLAYDLASFKNLKPEEAFEKLTSGITGEAEPLKRIGILVNDNTIKAYAYKNGIAAQGAELTEQQKVLARYGAIMEQTVNAQGDLARTIDSPTNKARIQGERFKQISTDIGNILIPMYDKVLDKLEQLTKWFDDLSQSQKENIVKIAAIAAAAGPLLVVLGSLTSAIGSLLTGVKFLGAGLTFLASNPIVLGLAVLAAGIGLIAYLATSANREAARMADTLIDSYRKEAQAQKEAIDKAHSYCFESLNKELSEEQSASNERIRLLDKEYDEEVKNANKIETAMKKSLQERKSVLDKSHNDEIQRIRDEYGVFEEKSKSRTDLVNEQYDKEVEKATEAYNLKIALIDAEYAASLKLLDQETQEKIKQVQDQIDAIDNKTKEEDRLEKERSNQQKILDYQDKIRNEKDVEKRRELQRDLQNFLTDLTRQKTLEQREIEKLALNQKIDEIKKAAEEQKKILETQTEQQKKILTDNLEAEKTVLAQKRDATIKIIQEERKAKEEAENQKYEYAKTAIEKEEAALDGFAERYKEKLEEGLAEKKRIEEAKLQAATDRINDEIKAEQDKVDAEKAEVDQQTRINVETVKINALQSELDSLNNRPWWQSGSTDIIRTSTLEKQIEAEKKRLHDLGIPGFAEGVRNWRGGLARINEKGGEIVNLPSGSNVIPHDISMQIAKAVGESSGGFGEIVITMPIILNGKEIQRSTSRIQVQKNKNRARAQGVPAT